MQQMVKTCKYFEELLRTAEISACVLTILQIVETCKHCEELLRTVEILQYAT